MCRTWKRSIWVWFQDVEVDRYLYRKNPVQIFTDLMDNNVGVKCSRYTKYETDLPHFSKVMKRKTNKDFFEKHYFEVTGGEEKINVFIEEEDGFVNMVVQDSTLYSSETSVLDTISIPCEDVQKSHIDPYVITKISYARKILIMI